MVRSLGGGIAGPGAQAGGAVELDELVELLRGSRKLLVKGAPLEG